MADLTITDWNDLNNVRNNLAGNHTLAADLDSNTSGYSTHVSGPTDGWDPIGTSSNPFTGSLNGNGHTIRDLDISRGSEEDVGLFGVINSTTDETIRNFIIDNPDVTGSGQVGAFCGDLQGGGENDVGNMYVHSIIVQSGTVRGGDFNIGGFVGRAQATTSSPLVVEDIIVHTMDIFEDTTSVTYVGGFAGSAGTVEIDRISVNVDIDMPNADFVAGIIGKASSNLTFTNTNAHGSIEANSDVAGAIADNNFGQSADMVTNFYGSIFLNGNSNVGGVVPNTDFTNDQTTNAYWDTQQSGVSTSGGDAVGLTTAEMTGDSAKQNMNLPYKTVWKPTTSGDAIYDNRVMSTNSYPHINRFSIPNILTNVLEVSTTLRELNFSNDQINDTTTIDNDEVNEINIDGTPTWRLYPLNVSRFEDGSINPDYSDATLSNTNNGPTATKDVAISDSYSAEIIGESVDNSSASDGIISYNFNTARTEDISFKLLMDHDSTGNKGTEFYVNSASTNNIIRIEWETNDGSKSLTFNGTNYGSWNNNQTYHVRISFDFANDQATLYIDDSTVGTESLGSSESSYNEIEFWSSYSSTDTYTLYTYIDDITLGEDYQY